MILSGTFHLWWRCLHDVYEYVCMVSFMAFNALNVKLIKSIYIIYVMSINLRLCIIKMLDLNEVYVYVKHDSVSL